MLVIFLILFTYALADSDEDKYVDLLPDAEKQQFIEKVARRILEDVESKENKGQNSGELSDEQLKKHNDYVKAILKQESENIRRNKGKAIKDRDEEKEKQGSDENLDVKPLENEKLADDPDLEQVDLTLRNDRREINPLDNSTEFIKVEILNDEPPIIKRSVQNDSYSESDSEEATTQVSQHQDTVTEGTETSSTVKTELDQFTNKSDDTTIKSNSTENLNAEKETKKIFESKSNENNTELENKDKKQNESIAVEDKVEDKSESSEKDSEDLQVIKSNTRKSIFGRSKLTETTTESDANTGAEYFGVKSLENKSEEYSSSTSSDTEESPIETDPPDTTTDIISTTQDIDAATEQSTATVFKLLEEEKGNRELVENITKITLTSTLSDEGTTDSDIDTTTSKTETETPTTDNYIPTRTEYFTDSPAPVVATTEGMKIIVENFTSAPKIELSDKLTPVKIGAPIIPNTNIKFTFKFKKRADESKEGTASQKSKVKKKDSKKKNRVLIKESSTSEELIPSDNLKPTTQKLQVIENLNNNFKQIKGNVDQRPDKNFIELEKVYYNKIKKKELKAYEVFEIPPNKPPFIQNGDPVTEQPYYVPVYNYSPNNAYYNPQNRLGPNADDDDSQISHLAIEESVQNLVAEGIVKEDSAIPKNVDVAYSESAFDNQRKKFGNKQKVYHSIHKRPQQNGSPEQTKGKVNPEDYQDSDYYFGRVRKDSEIRENHNNDPYPNSDENVDPFHNMHEMNLKDHVRAVRNILFKKKIFGLATTLQPYDSVEDFISKKKQARISEHENENHPFRNGGNDHKRNNNIAIDYYFGRMKPKGIQSNAKDGKTEANMQQIGYIKNENDTKELYMIDQLFKDNVLNYVQQLKSKDNTLDKSGLMPATPKPFETYKTPEQRKPTAESTFRNQEKIRNAELNKIAGANNVHTITKVLSMGNKKDVFTNLEKVQELKMSLHRRNEEVKLNVYITVLKDMLNADSKALKQYDWLGTTVDIQASFQKLFELVAVVADGDRIHPADLEILKYVIFLHKLAGEIIEAKDLGKQLRYNYALPRNNKRGKGRIIKEKGLLNRVWLYLRKKVPEVDESGALKNLNMFLMDLEDNLYNIHDAIKNVAKVTKYRNQHWYQNLKEIYLNTDEKHLLELLLHICVSRLFGLVEDSAKNGMEDDYIAYMKKNKAEAKKTLEELLFVIQIMDEINKHVE